ncbi:MAG: N-acetyltransferase [Candidatus Diapherotrites archaeon]|nr:N-acetyltransferase [Candidatus Diapherotrites archaeon]
MIKKATMRDAENIKELLSSYAKKRLLLDRSVVGIYEGIREFFVAEKDGKFAGCCALHFCWEDLAEIRSLAVKEKFKDNGYGKRLVEAALEEAKGFGVKKVFTLTFVPVFFRRLGFAEISKDALPHKIWSDCINCVHFPNCRETAMAIEIK